MREHIARPGHHRYLEIVRSVRPPGLTKGGIWDASTGVETPPPLQGHRDDISSVAFSPDGSQIISESNDGTIHVLDASTEFLSS